MKFSHLFAATIVVLGIAGCTSSEESSDVQRTSESGQNTSGTMTAASAAPAGIGCGWQAASDPDNTNIAFPDSSAKYWVAGIVQTPGTRIRIDGAYPNARYFSYNVYDPAQRPVDAIADFEISPNDNGGNPFEDKNGRAKTYTAYVQFGDSPTQNTDISRANNTVYSGSIAAGPAGIPNGGMNMLIYRIYVSKEGEFFNGGVALPTLTLESADGSRVFGTLPNCEEPLLPTLGGNAPKLGLNERITGADYPDQVPTHFIVGDANASTKKFFSLFETAAQIGKARSEQFPSAPDSAPFNGGGGFLSNIHNAYVSTTYSRRYGSVAMWRAKMPTFRSQRGVGFGKEQIRYWSVCGNEFATQRFTDCVLDERAVTDSEGYVTVVVSDVADRPANVTPENGFNWVPWGAYADMVLIYRQMLPRSDFAQAIEFQPYGGDLKQGMGEYFPDSTYCDPKTLAIAQKAPDAFKLCKGFKSDSLGLPFN